MPKIIKSIFWITISGFFSELLLADTVTDAFVVGKPIVVTATRTAQTVDDTLASVTVIGREEIERRQVQSVQEALRGVPGLGITNAGGLGKASSVFLRGTESDHVLVLIDGVKVGSATLGTTAFQDLPIDQVERIEVVRGPRSSLYGSEAIGGVIQIFTRRNEVGFQPYLSAGTGSHQTYQVAGGISGNVDNAWYSFNVSHLTTDGINACEGNPFPPFGGCFTIESDDDGYDNTSGSARLGYRFNNGVEIEGHFLHASSNTDFDGTSNSGNSSDSVQQVYGGKIRFSPVEIWDVTLSGGRSKDDLDVFFQGGFIDAFTTKRITALIQNDITVVEDHLLTLGFEYWDDEVQGTTNYEINHRDNKGIFGQYQLKAKAVDIIGGVRYDHNEQFGGQVTGNIGLGYSFENGTKVTAAFGTAFKAPTFNELFFPDFGNPDLDPEESESVEVGLTGNAMDIDWQLNAYYTRIDELISFVLVPPASFRAVNVDEAQIFGLEALASTRIFGWDIAANLSLIDHQIRGSGLNKGNLLPRRAEQMFRVDIDRGFGAFQFGTTVFGEGRRFDDLANTRRLGGYVTVDLRAGYQIHRDWLLQLKVGNLFGKNYETAEFFNQDGGNLFFTIRYQPKPI